MTALQIRDFSAGRNLLLGLCTTFDWSRHTLDWSSLATTIAQAIGLKKPPANDPIPFPTRKVAEREIGGLAYRFYDLVVSEDHEQFQPFYDPLNDGTVLKTVPVLSAATIESASELIPLLKKRGHYQLGSGCFSTAFTRLGSDRVVKVNTRPDGLLSYYLWGIEAGFSGTLAPRIYAAHEYPDGTYAVVMERFEAVVQSVPFLHTAYRSLRTDLHNSRGTSDFVMAFRNRFPDQALDLHDHNFMVRPNGSLCLTDPFTGGEVRSGSYRRHSLSSLRLAA